jgi:hypothetical protein
MHNGQAIAQFGEGLFVVVVGFRKIAFRDDHAADSLKERFRAAFDDAQVREDALSMRRQQSSDDCVADVDADLSGQQLPCEVGRVSEHPSQIAVGHRSLDKALFNRVRRQGRQPVFESWYGFD